MMTVDTQFVDGNFIYGKTTIKYSLLKMDRATLEIAVLPDCSVVVKVPADTDEQLVQQRLRKRARWILKQLNYFEQFNPKQPPKQYIRGETHLYMGRRYRLKIVNGETDSVKLMRGYFVVTCKTNSSPSVIKKLMDRWYRQKAIEQFESSLEAGWKLFKCDECEKPVLVVKAMKTRWGSLSEKGTMTLNSALIKASKECIDYVVVHELCHLKFKNHNKEFYKLLSVLLPNWQKTKHCLETMNN